MNFSRRGLMVATAAVAAATSAGAKPRAAAAPPAWTPDATELAGRIRRKEVSAVEVVEAAIRKAEALQPKIGAIVTSDFDRAMDKARSGQASGPFAGVPFLIKDLDPYVGLPTRFGSRSSLGARPVKTQTPFIDAYDRAGLVVIGKSSTPEYGFLPTTEPMGFLPTRNPWNLGHSSGGSSGGAAAATAAGIVPFAHATDGGGSIRIPAANCGLFGMKPSRGRMLDGRPNNKGIDLSVAHCVTHSVRDSAALFAVSEDTEAGATFAPIGVVTGPGKGRLKVGLLLETGTGLRPDPEVVQAVESAAKLMESLGHKVETTHWPIDGNQFGRDFTALWSTGAAELAAGVSKAMGRPADASVLEPFTLGMAELVRGLKPGDIPAVVERLQAAAKAYDTWLTRYDVILSPVLGHVPADLGFVSGNVSFETLQARLLSYVGYTPLHNVAGAPAMSVPLHWTADGLPVGVHFAGRIGGEKRLFELAYQLEAAQPWAHRKPPTSL